MKNSKQIITSLLAEVGVAINGNKPYDIQIHNENFYNRVLRQKSIGLGESYMDGWWDCQKLDELFYKILSNDLNSKIKNNKDLVMQIFANLLFNSGIKSKAFEVGEKHYDIGNDLYKNMLDKRLTYTCGYWKNGNNLDEAQENKLDLICKKLYLKKGQKILDIGSGWGSFTGYASEKYQVQSIGITVSKEQKKFTDEKYKNLMVETRLQDYRDLNERFDNIVSIGMFEHVGKKNYRKFAKIVHDSLEDDGLFLLHTIGCEEPSLSIDPWIEKYIFPNGMTPSAKNISQAINGLFIIEDWHNFGYDYYKTLIAWHKNFDDNWDVIKSNYNERFYRMWRYYLLSCAGSFKARKLQLWQIVLSKNGVSGGYNSIR